MAFNYSKLRGRIVEKFGSIGEFAKAIGLTRSMLSLKINGKSEWGQDQIILACELLDIDPAEIGSFFYDREDQQN